MACPSPKRRRIQTGESSPEEDLKVYEATAERQLSELSEEEKSWLVAKLVFWFSAPNLRKDGFLAKIISSENNIGGWVDITSILTFNTLRDANISGEQVLGAAALIPDVLEYERGTGSDGLGRLRLKGGRPTFQSMTSTEQMKEEDERTLYVSPLPGDITRETLRAALGARFTSEIVYVSLPRSRGKSTGSGFGFVEFNSVESAKECASALAQKRISEFARRFPLARGITRTEWRETKNLAKQRRREEKKSSKQMKTQKTPSEENPEQDDSRKAPPSKPQQSYAASQDDLAQRDGISGPSYKQGVVATVSGYELPTTRGALRDVMAKLGQGEVAYMDYKSSSPESSFCRFADHNSAQRAADGAKPPLRVQLLTGDDEKRYWEDLNARSNEKRSRAASRAQKRAKNMVYP